ncbi:hypothetical protein [Ekhidna sp.]|uniref:hypothetical protein n=1 Tax=Ekhidna sp. TaxID=2608089 RepID=UPI003511191E
MKKINIILAALLLVSFWGCEPLEDEIKLVEEQTVITKDLVYTLTDDDYDVADDACDCSGFGSFSSEAGVKVGIPAVLDNNFPALGKGSSAVVTYNFYNGSSPDLNGTEFTYTVTAQEYTDLGYNFGSFDDLSGDIPTYASFKEPNAEDGDFMDITHEYYDGSSTSTVTSRGVYTVAYGWQYAFILPDAAYGDFFGESGIDFSTSDEGKEKMPVYLNEFNSLFVDEGTTMVVQFNFDDRFTEGGSGNPNVPDVGLYIFSGGEWLLYNDHFQTTAETLSFANDGSEWVADNTIKLTLDASAYASIGAATATSNPDGSASAIQYSNFDLGLWTSDEIFDAITSYLESTVPSVDGQKYLVTYATWEPGAGTGQIYVIYSDADGKYIPFVAE